MEIAIRRYLRKEIIVRVVADATLVNAALILALIARYLWDVAVAGDGGAASPLLREYADTYLKSFGFLTLVTTVVFGLNGLYTYARHYPVLQKLLTNIQAVTLSYVLFTFVVLVLRPLSLSVPRSVVVMGWILTAAFTVGARTLSAPDSPR